MTFGYFSPIQLAARAFDEMAEGFCGALGGRNPLMGLSTLSSEVRPDGFGTVGVYLNDVPVTVRLDLAGLSSKPRLIQVAETAFDALWLQINAEFDRQIDAALDATTAAAPMLSR